MHPAPVSVGVLALTTLLVGCRARDKSVGVVDAGEAGDSREAGDGSTTASRSCAAGLSRAPHDGWHAVATAGSVACALHANGRVACWGPNAVGRGTEWLSCSDPAWIDGLSDIVSLHTAGSSAICARTSKRETSCWGLGHWGSSTRSGYAFEPARAPHLDAYSKLAMSPNPGTGHACGIDAKSALDCWGYGSLGQVGRADPASRYLPAAPVLREASAVAAGGVHTCAIVKGFVLCWGYAEHGTLGDGSEHARNCHIETAPHAGPGLPGHYRKCDGPDPIFLAPQRVVDITAATIIAASHASTCALAAGRVKCWGVGYGATPVDTGIEGAVDLVGNQAFCARETTGGVQCLLGSGPTATALKRIDALAGAKMIAAAGGRVCGVLERGTVRCAGTNQSGLPLDDWTTAPSP